MAFPSILGCHRCSQTELFNSVRQCCFRPRLRGWSTYTVTVCSLVSPHCMNSGAILLLLYCCYHFMKSTFQAKKKKLSKNCDLFCHWRHILLSITSEKKHCQCVGAETEPGRSLCSVTRLKRPCWAPLPFTLLLPCGGSWYEGRAGFDKSVNLSSLRWLINNRKRDGLWC